MPELSSTALLSLSLFGLSALLLVSATRLGPTPQGRGIALYAMLVCGGAIYTMFITYPGERGLVFERPGPLEKRPAQPRGEVEWAEREEAESRDRTRPDRPDAPGGSIGDDAMGGDASLGGAAATRTRGFLALFRNQGDRINVEKPRRDCEDCPDMVVVEPGYFIMGATVGDDQARPSELPRRTIKVARHFAISRTEVTREQFMIFVHATGHSAPPCVHEVVSVSRSTLAECVSWRDAMAYAAWLGAISSRTYRLPTEAEWEWAARGGSRERYTTGSILAPRRENGFGLGGVHAGVAEIVAGCWAPDLHSIPGHASMPDRSGQCSRQVLRDGGGLGADNDQRLSARRPIHVDERRAGVGFRVVREM